MPAFSIQSSLSVSPAVSTDANTASANSRLADAGSADDSPIDNAYSSSRTQVARYFNVAAGEAGGFVMASPVCEHRQTARDAWHGSRVPADRLRSWPHRQR